MAAKKSPTKKPAAVPALLEQLERALKKRYPSVHETLRPGLDAKGVERLSRCVSKKLPPDFVALYRWHDGVSGEELFQEWGLLPLSDVEREQRTLRRAARATFGGETLAFMSNFAGDLLYLDLAGVLGGKPGQVLAWRHEEPKAPEVVFANVRQLVLTMAEAAKKGLLLPDDDEDAFERLYTRLNPHRGDGDLKAILKAIEKTSEPKKRLALTDRALALDRKNRDVWRARSDALSDLDRDEEAADALAEEIALTKEPFMRARLGVRRAELLNYAGCHQRAAQAAKAIVKELERGGDRGDLAAAWAAIQTAEAELGNEREALTAAKKAATVFEGPEATAAKYWMSYTHVETDPKRLRQARDKTRKLLRKWVGASPHTANDHEAWYNMACMSALLGEADAAHQELSKAVGLNRGYASDAPGDDDFASVRGESWFKKLTGARS
ncbi:MAG: SMI1/KNR4 family protein [Polyangiaceae bacterium]|nr:SMI1/KNR4 family protein [Polyangiaceae bacterium]